jgi:hypothetical protein
MSAQRLCSRLPAALRQRLGGLLLAVVSTETFRFLVRADPRGLDGVADHFGGVLPALGAFVACPSLAYA